MIFKKKQKVYCETPVCDNELDDDPAIIVIDEHEFRVCNDCARVMELMQEKFDERLNDESL